MRGLYREPDIGLADDAAIALEGNRRVGFMALGVDAREVFGDGRGGEVHDADGDVAGTVGGDQAVGIDTGDGVVATEVARGADDGLRGHGLTPSTLTSNDQQIDNYITRC